VSILIRIQNPVLTGSNSGRESGFFPATSCASWATVIGLPSGESLSTVTRAFAGTR
jgi:hypothetical protein